MNVAVTKSKAINYSRKDISLVKSLIQNKVLSLQLDIKSAFSLQYGEFPPKVFSNFLPSRTSLFLNQVK